jgi:hypothetical protein
MTHDPTRDCEHGRLKGKCDVCDLKAEAEADKTIIEYHEATIKRLEALLKSEREAVIGLLRGIDETEYESAEGWWETSTGAEFGAGILAAIRARGNT